MTTEEIKELEWVESELCQLSIERQASGSPSATLLEGWSVQHRSYGVGTCFGGSGDVLCYGKWGVIGGTGRYKILFPSGWIEERPKFKTELEAMLWVKSQGKPKPSNDQADRLEAEQ
jgi:hypothetical protein